MVTLLLWAVSPFMAMLATQKASVWQVMVPDDTIVTLNLYLRWNVLCEVDVGE